MKFALFLLFALVAVACVSANKRWLGSRGYYRRGYNLRSYRYGPRRYFGRYRYYGSYKGACGVDGVYARSSNTLVFCTNGRALVQKCAPGSAISGLKKGSYYSWNAVCNVNLLG
ncbi:uncharacterized protein LOC106165171 [Lingula anatina]|uniref:Uncharacterized protein LOC106165171 n=1 Tax=Lingula anatina TaxID=7574 RepID=A0A1S3IKI8_LINAN|nr:uncharacterized protein LOC106165171 [Lingula anatina]|eukprot:XP_013398727.1 uncharacterized protein LOC106165171 [Lingula anatina]